MVSVTAPLQARATAELNWMALGTPPNPSQRNQPQSKVTQTSNGTPDVTGCHATCHHIPHSLLLLGTLGTLNFQSSRCRFFPWYSNTEFLVPMLWYPGWNLREAPAFWPCEPKGHTYRSQHWVSTRQQPLRMEQIILGKEGDFPFKAINWYELVMINRSLRCVVSNSEKVSWRKRK